MTSVDHAEDGSSVKVNLEGPATGFGTVLGTSILKCGAPEKAGTCSWRSQAFLAGGEQKLGLGEGTWDEIGEHRWRVRLLIRISDGDSLRVMGPWIWRRGTMKGKVLEWS